MRDMGFEYDGLRPNGDIRVAKRHVGPESTTTLYTAFISVTGDVLYDSPDFGPVAPHDSVDCRP